MKNRYPKELAIIKKTWEDFVAGIRHGEAVPRGFFDGSDIRDLAKRVNNMADYMSRESCRRVQTIHIVRLSMEITSP